MPKTSPPGDRWVTVDVTVTEWGEHIGDRKTSEVTMHARLPGDGQAVAERVCLAALGQTVEPADVVQSAPDDPESHAFCVTAEQYEAMASVARTFRDGLPVDGRVLNPHECAALAHLDDREDDRG